MAGACSAISISLNSVPTVGVPTAAPFALSYGSLGHVLTSDNWAGYVIADTMPAQVLPRHRPGRAAIAGIGTVTDIRAQWLIPTVTCTARDTYSAIWVGIDGETDGTVEQVGTGVDCTNGQPNYYAWFEIFPRPSQDISQFPVKAGDNVSAEVKYNGAGVFDLTVQDLNSGQNFSTSRTNLRALRQSAEWVVEAPANQNNQVLPLAAFSTITFTQAKATINGQQCTISQCTWSHGALVMESPDRKLKAYPSPLNANGSSFSVAWRGS